MNLFYKKYTFLLLTGIALFTGSVLSAQSTISAKVIHKVDSLNELAFVQKRTNVAASLNNLFVAENLATTIPYKKGLAIAYLYEAGIFHQIGYEKKALSIYFKALQIFQSENDAFNIAKAQKEIAAAYHDEGKTAEAIQLYNESLSVYTKMNKPNEIANIKNSIGLIELDLGKFSSAENDFQQALQISIEKKYIYGEKKAYYNLGLLHLKKNSFATAEEYFNQSLAKDKILNDYYSEALNLIQLANVLREKHNKSEAVDLSKKAYELAAKVSAYNIMKDVAKKMIEDLKQQEGPKQSSAWQDSLVRILELEIENEREYSLNFIDVIKSQNILKINAENEAVRSRRIAKEQLVIITIGTFALITLAVLAVLALVNYQRQRFFGKELTKKNIIIEKNANSLDQLNKEISHQNELLEEDNKNKNKLLSIISHDLRTPLVNTKGILNLFNLGMMPQVASENLMQQLETQYQRTTTLLDNLLYWIKGQISGQDVHNESINFYQLVKSLEQEYHASLANKHLELVIHIDNHLMIYAEKEMIQIIFRNLLSNAIKFTPTHGKIEIESSFTEGFVQLTLKDNGIGMSPENLEKVMARKYFSTKGTEMERGSGFGLMLCKDLITRQGGDMLIQTNPDEGTAITVRIPHVHANSHTTG